MKKESNNEIEQNVDTTDAPDAAQAQSDDTVSEAQEETASDSDEEKVSDNADDKNDSVASEADNTSDDNEDEKSSGKNTTLIIELLIAAAAIVFIIFALVGNNKDNNSVSDNNAASGNIVNGDITTPDASVVDNSVLYENIPAIPDLSELNIITEAEAESMVSDGSMIKLSLADGGTVYINNYTDTDYFSEHVVPSEEDVDEAIFYNITRYYIETVEGSDHTTVENGDVILADFVGKLDGVAFDGGSASNVEIMVGIGEYIPGFEEGFIGMEVGETKDVPVTFPVNYGNTDLAGKNVIFTFTVNEITGAYAVPELNDQMVQENFIDGSATTVEECYEYFKTMMTQDNIRTFMIDQYYVTSVSEESVHAYYNLIMDSYNQTSMAYQISIADLLSYSGETIDSLKADTILNAAYTAIEYSIYETIATEEGLTVTDEDIADLAIGYGYADSESFISDFGEESVNGYLLQTKVLDYLMSLL